VDEQVRARLVEVAAEAINDRLKGTGYWCNSYLTGLLAEAVIDALRIEQWLVPVVRVADDGAPVFRLGALLAEKRDPDGYGLTREQVKEWGDTTKWPTVEPAPCRTCGGDGFVGPPTRRFLCPTCSAKSSRGDL
jgi:hypothetical protein